MMMGFVEEERARRWQEYVDALEEEKKKIHVFQRELPLCLELVSRTIEIYRKQMIGEMVVPARSECEEQTSSELPVLEEFIPIKRSSSDDQMEDADDEEENNSRGGEDQKHQNEKKPDWLRSAQLWNQQPEPSTQTESKPKKPIVVEAKKATGAFLPFNKEKNAPAVEAPPAVSSTAEVTSRGGSDDKDGQSNRKPRRCWSPELHRRFLHALQQLGGSHAATPKQIRELMKVDGLTNDEVKSHLQKYRLHTRRPSPTSPTSNSRSPPPQQFILVGGLWVPPTQSDYGKAQSLTTNKIYAPIASLPVRSQSNNNKDNNCRDDDRIHSNSPATSASSLTITTTSPRS